MNPEPLNFDFKNFFERFKEVYNILKKDLGWEWELSFEEFIKDIKNLEEDIDEIESSALDYEYAIKLGMYYVYQKTNSACEFYLKYKNNPIELWNEYPQYRCKRLNYIVDSLHKNFEAPMSFKSRYFEEYNLWLFKLAFKDVLYTKTVGGED